MIAHLAGTVRHVALDKVIVEVGGEIIDGSIASRLTNLKQQLVSAAGVNRS